MSTLDYLASILMWVLIVSGAVVMVLGCARQLALRHLRRSGPLGCPSIGAERWCAGMRCYRRPGHHAVHIGFSRGRARYWEQAE